MSSSAQHHRWMAQALRLARKGFYSAHPNPRVGCVIVKNDVLLGEGWHQFTGGAHAEVNAIQSTVIPAGADFYVTLEPCSHHGRTPPCVDAVIAARAARVIVAMQDPNPEVSGRGLEQLRKSGIEVISGVLESEARQLNRGFIKRMQQQLPFVSIKMALSLDGRSALANGVSQWISGEAARRDVQYLRAGASAILSSAQTVLDDDPSLNTRLGSEELNQSLAPRQPVRVLVDSQLRLSGKEKIFSTDGEIWIYSCSENEAVKRQLRDSGAQVIDISATESGQVSLQAMLRDMAARGINDVHTECGPRLAGALIDQQLADQLILYLAPHLLGDQARGGFSLGELTTMDRRKTCRICDIRQIGEDIRLTLNLEQE
ncbi:MAG: bifunctional diaminohydroxyphosphoribosylaminopyrimidine deaminase/5-amino-6-(5-phosphoribosylamino)uracil reductase RibD [Gammaproteobacteria bacterium]|nr:bifunctional diaminohydroxyphosphoribosylaminopyrimidine deaminase/5-amino-6-(5-phosphoribosylamino)uracil reductase RibD [Gammaproteobacteria bacterium]